MNDILTVKFDIHPLVKNSYILRKTLFFSLFNYFSFFIYERRV